MKILVVSGFSMYPAYSGETRRYASYAFHEMLKHYKKHNDVEIRVICLRLRYPKIFNYFKRVRVFNTKNNGFSESYIDDVLVYNLPIFKFPKLPVLSSYIRKKSDYLRKVLLNVDYKPDIIISITTGFSKRISENLKEYFSCPVILSVHNCDVFSMKRNTNFDKIDFFSFRSPKIKKNFFEKVSKKPLKFTVDTFGIDESLIIKERENTNKKKLKMIAVGSLIPLKNFDILIQAVAKSLEYVEELNIYGEGFQREKLKKIIDKNKLNEVVKLLGEKPKVEVLENLRISDVFALVSSPETLGLAYLEALAKGCIVIGTKDEGIDGVIIDGVNGFLCKPKDVEMLHKVIKKIFFLTESGKSNITKNALSTAKRNTNQFFLKKYITNCFELIEKGPQ